MGKSYELQTDTHLSKDFNKVLQDCMIKCNEASLRVQTLPHYEYMKLYYSTISNFFKNTFHLFGNIKWDDSSLMNKLIEYMMGVRKGMELMRKDIKYQQREFFFEIIQNCDLIHMMIMYGLQKRNMLVRMSETEPKGVESIEHWKDRETFKKGDLKIKKLTKENAERFYI